MKYNYVILGSEADFYMASYADLFNCSYAKYLWRRIDTDSPIITFLYRIHMSPITNKFIELPMKSIWNRWVFREKFDNDNPICFIFFAGRNKEINNGAIYYLRSKYKNCKTVLFYQDLVKKSALPQIEKIRNQFDLILSFDQLDVKKYNLLYYPLVYSKTDIKKSDIPKSDIYFVGKAKDRLEDIREVYSRLKDSGLKCDFHITGVSPEDVREDGIVYNMPVSYEENLQRIKASKCMLEIMQKGGHGYTLRYCEAIMYDKKIITNNPEIKEAPFYSEQRIQVFENPHEITSDFVLEGEGKVDYGYKDKLSPKRLLDFLDNKL
ncbi:hypothetical protein DXD84_06890 [Dorea formicigenerans]|uniref:Glycosyltransferase family 1 protein n=1 Tax=Dorea formicigenerans TaxID=39486 RepID=A0A3E4F727_9FIRM|nr:hypothetical protein [Dorea formicigenerans]RGI84659.1 hypothetical protein DXD84_06890 [Dorea formicigenerans]RGI88172.1 hypothetical protein DXD82_06280 [Dorea formicigenerans]